MSRTRRHDSSRRRPCDASVTGRAASRAAPPERGWPQGRRGCHDTSHGRGRPILGTTCRHGSRSRPPARPAAGEGSGADGGGGGYSSGHERRLWGSRRRATLAQWHVRCRHHGRPPGGAGVQHGRPSVAAGMSPPREDGSGAGGRGRAGGSRPSSTQPLREHTPHFRRPSALVVSRLPYTIESLAARRGGAGVATLAGAGEESPRPCDDPLRPGGGGGGRSWPQLCNLGTSAALRLAIGLHWRPVKVVGVGGG